MSKFARSPVTFASLLLSLLIALWSCGENKAATECYNLQNVLIAQRDSRFGTVNKASELAKARREQSLAEAFKAVELSDTELRSRRDTIVALIMQQHSFSLRSAEIMTESGRLSSDRSAQYEALFEERRPIDDEFYAQINGLRIHCSLQ